MVEEAEIDFGAALNVLTGETGAGKSVLMGAIDLVLGGRADASVVREGAKEAEVEAVFDSLTVRRTVTAEGRSRAWIDDESVTIGELKEAGLKLVDVHGPTANQKLLEESFQRETLGPVPEAYSAAWSAYSAIKTEIKALEESGVSEDEAEIIKFQVNELESAALSEEDETIAERHAAAAHAEEIIENANQVTEGLGGDCGAAEVLIALQPKLKAMARHFPAAEEWSSRVEELTLGVQELSRTVADAISRLDAGEEDLSALDERLTLINKLKRKYLNKLKCEVEVEGKGGEIARLMAVLENKRARLDTLEHFEERREELAAKLSAAEKTLRAAGAALTKARTASAAKLGKSVTRELKDLGFNEARFSIALEATEPEVHGCDRVVYMFEPNPGEPARPLAAIASSGEIARVMLALKVVLGSSVPTLVFDEIDANIGGEVGRITGEKLRAVAKKHQVVAITHLPQSAVFGERHFVVRKKVDGGRTRTTVGIAEGEERVREIARMLGGETLTSVVKKHAEELLSIAAAGK